jgi:hypothetical protein
MCTQCLLKKAGETLSLALLFVLSAPSADARLNVPELPVIEGVNIAAGPIAALEGIVVYFVYLLASLFVVWVILSVGKRVINEFNDARRESGDYGRVIVTAFVGMGVTLFIVFLANYLVNIIS